MQSTNYHVHLCSALMSRTMGKLTDNSLLLSFTEDLPYTEIRYDKKLDIISYLHLTKKASDSSQQNKFVLCYRQICLHLQSEYLDCISPIVLQEANSCSA
jgi:hypothetical protein